MQVLGRFIVFALVATVTAVGVGALLVATTPRAEAAQTTPPPYSHSWYVQNANATDWYNWAKYVDGPFDNSRCTNSLVVLDFGQPQNVNGAYGTNIFVFQNPFVNVLQIIYILNNYARGWYEATSSCTTLTLVAGTNNFNQLPSGSGSVSTAGSIWADVVRGVHDYLISTGYSTRVAAWAGDDIEQEWDCANRTRQFVDGYNGNPNATTFLDYGTAWSDPCWTTNDKCYVAYGAAHDYPLPEIYFESAMASWVNLRLSCFMYFYGVMTTCQQNDPLPADYCTTPAGWYAPALAWGALYWNLAASGVPQNGLDYATNIRKLQ